MGWDEVAVGCVLLIGMVGFGVFLSEAFSEHRRTLRRARKFERERLKTLRQIKEFWAEQGKLYPTNGPADDE